MAAVWTDGTWTAAYAVSAPEFSSPIPGVSTAYVLTQDFVQLAANFTPLALNTKHADYDTFYLVSESPRVPLGEGVVKWTRTYAAKPAAHDEWETYAYQFIGITGTMGINVETVTGRERQVQNVTSRIHNEYFLCGSDLWADYATAGAIPVVKATQYCFENISLPINFTFDGTEPTTADYQSAVADAAANGWTSSVTSQTIDAAGDVTASTWAGQIIAEDSKIARWMGNIWVRQTRYVLAR